MQRKQREYFAGMNDYLPQRNKDEDAEEEQEDEAQYDLGDTQQAQEEFERGQDDDEV